MNSKSGRSQKIRHNYTKIYVLTAVLAVIAAAVLGLTYLHFANIAVAPAPQTAEPTGTVTAPAETATPTVETPTAETPTPTPTPQSSIDRLNYSATDFVKPSPLMPISEEHPYDGTLAGLINCYEAKNKSLEAPIPLSSSSIEMRPDAFKAFEELHNAVHAEYNNLSLIVVVGYTDDPGATRCTSHTTEKPCLTDEHASGYAADCWFLTVDKKSLQFYDGAAAVQTKFALDKAASLGIIQSKAKVAGHTQNDLRHLRYVGVPHAQYIYENDLTLEGYLEIVRTYNFNKRLTVTTADAVYEIYYVKAETSGDTVVSVPAGSDFSVMSDHIEGYVITLRKALSA